MSLIRDRHETLNGRLQNWNCLRQIFLHPLQKHNLLYRNIIVLEQIKIDNGQKLFKIIEYHDNMLA